MIGFEADQLERERRKAKHRSNVMLAAIIQMRGLSANVRIRNISETGALLESSTVPEAGTDLVLSRDQLNVPARVAWARESRFGLQFEHKVVVAEWVGHALRPATHSGQRRIDQLQADIRAGIAPPPAPAPQVRADAGNELDAKLPERLAEEIAYVQRLIESIGDELIVEPLILHRHAGTLQKFDAANQILGHISAILSASDRVRAAERVGMEELRSRLLRD
jgi:hypothetical protein